MSSLSLLFPNGPSRDHDIQLCCSEWNINVVCRQTGTDEDEIEEGNEKEDSEAKSVTRIAFITAEQRVDDSCLLSMSRLCGSGVTNSFKIKKLKPITDLFKV